MSVDLPLFQNGQFPILPPTKTKYLGAFPAGFLERARMLLTGPDIRKAILYLPGGRARDYNRGRISKHVALKGFGPNDWTIDINPHVDPDIQMDVARLDQIEVTKEDLLFYEDAGEWPIAWPRPDAVLIDRPYDHHFHQQYTIQEGMPMCKLPSLAFLLRHALRIVKPFGAVGILEWTAPDPVKIGAKCIGRWPIDMGNNSRTRLFTTWMRMEDWKQWGNFNAGPKGLLEEENE